MASVKSVYIFASLGTLAGAMLVAFITEPEQPCEQEIQIVGKTSITWPLTESGSAAVSTPICLDSTLKIMTRQCKENGWSEQPQCVSIQKPINPCPDGFKHLDQYCYKILRDTTFPPTCPYPGELGWESYQKLGIFPHGESIWMPIQRIDSDYGIDIYRFTEKTSHYYTPFRICTQSCRSFFYKDTFLDKKCQVYHNSTHIEAVSCDDKHTAVCVYQSINHQSYSLCQQTYDNCRQGDYRGDSMCFCETESSSVGHQVLADFVVPYQNLLFTNSCRFGLKNEIDDSDVSYFYWISSNTPINYTYWSQDVNFSQPFGVVTSSGWKLSDATSTCMIYQLNLLITAGTLALSVHKDEFTLTITNYASFLSWDNVNPVVYCFTDADATTILYRFSGAGRSADGGYTIKFSPSTEQAGPGHYWCEAFLYPELVPVSSNVVFYSNVKGEYVVLSNLKHYEEKLGLFPLTAENIDTLQNLFRNELPKNISFYPRLLKINNIDESNKEMKITFHLTSSEATNSDEEYRLLEWLSMGQAMFELIDFRSVKYCAETITKDVAGQPVVWPRIDANSWTYPKQGYCVNPQVKLVSRNCTGDFINGAHWTDNNDTCLMFAVSAVTDKLIQIGENVIMEALQEISKRHEEFNTLDFVLVVKYLHELSEKFEQMDLEALSEIVSNLMLVERAVLLSAQYNFKSPDQLLQIVDVILENQQGYGLWRQPNFAIASLDISNGTLGLQLKNCSNYKDCDLEPITNNTSLYNGTFIVDQTVEAAISLSTTLLNQLANESITKLIVIVYYGCQLFVEMEDTKSSSMIFGVLLPGYNEDFQGPVRMFYYTKNNKQLLNYNCSFWQFNESSTGVWTADSTDKFEDAVVCEFYHLTHFKTPFNIPEDKCPLMDDYQICVGLQLTDKFCSVEDKILVPTFCFVDFQGSALLSDISEDCSSIDMSLNIRKIINMTNADDDEQLMNLLKSMTSDVGSMDELSVLFVAYGIRFSSDLTSITEIVNNLMRVSRLLLHNAQEKYGALNVLLKNIEASLLNGPCLVYSTVNFVIYCLKIDHEQIGIGVSNCAASGNNCDVAAIDKSGLDNFDRAAVYLSTKLHKQIEAYAQKNSSYSHTLVVSIYYNSHLFVDLKENTSTSSLVFSVLLPDFHDEFQGPLIIEYIHDLHSNKYNCSYWKFDGQASGSWKAESTLETQQMARCEFYHLTNFAFPVERLIADFHFKEFEEHVESNFSNHSVASTAAAPQSNNQTPMTIIITSDDIVHVEGLLINFNYQDVRCKYQNILGFDNDPADLTIDLDQNLRNQIHRSKSNTIITLLFEDQLTKSDKVKVILPIVEIVIPNLHGKLEGVITLKYTYADSMDDVKCSYWDSVSNYSFWNKESDAVITAHVACTFDHVTHFALVTSAQNITTDLEKILASNLTAMEKLQQVEAITYSNYQDLLSIDVFLISQILLESLTQRPLTKPITIIISNLFMVDRGVLRESQEQHGATDILLYTIDRVMGMVDDEHINQQNFSLIVKSLNGSNMTGLLLHNCTDYSCNISYLYEFVNVNEFADNNSIAAVVYFCEDLVNQIRNSSNSKVGVSIHFSNVFFNEMDHDRSTTIVFGVIFPGLTTLSGNVSVVFNLGGKSSDNDQCAYWHYKADPTGQLSNATQGHWINDTRQQRNSSLAICQYSHVTHFGMLLDDSGSNDDDPLLDLLTDIGCILSLFGISVILVTAMFYKKWRQNTGNKILINFSMAISLKIVTLYISVYVKKKMSGTPCIITGVILHYAILSECAWMLTVAILQFKRFVEVLGGPPKYVLVKALICGWLFPLIPVICVLSFDPSNYEQGLANVCYPSNLGLYLGVWLPVLLVLSINCIIFTFIIYNIFHKKTEYIDSSNNDILFQWRLALLLFFMLGLNWIFGFLGQLNGDVLFTYLYSITASLQGFVLFLFFIVFNKSTRFLYSQSVKQWFYSRGMFRLRQTKSKTYPKFKG